MKKFILTIMILASVIAISAISGCNFFNKEEPSNSTNPFPLTNEIQNTDGTLVKPPKW